MIEIKDEIIKSDVLVIGGGIGGLMAAIAAAEAGASVVVAEKADTLRSGSGATGNDHFCCYIPEFHGDIDNFVRELQCGMCKDRVDPTLQYLFAKRSFEIVQDWEKWGINMRPTGEYVFNGHAMPEHIRIMLKYDGTNQKIVLTEQALKRGVKIINKTPIAEFIADDKGRISGAVGIDISKDEPRLQLFQTKAVITATGIGMRLYPSTTPGWIGNLNNCPAGTAAGRVAAYRLGATLVNIDYLWLHAGPKYFERCGKATWIGVLKDLSGKPVGPFVTKPTKELGDITADIWQEVFVEKRENGTGPVYMDCTETSQEDLDYMTWGLTCEGDTSLLDAMEKQGIDLHEDMVEFGRYNPNLQGKGLQVDIHMSTDVPGLYCAGDECGNFNMGIAGASTTGRIAGENAAEYVKNIGEFSDIKHDPIIRECQEFYSELLGREDGANWRELNMAVQQIMDDYTNTNKIRSETILSAGLTYLDHLEAEAKKQVRCANAHELMRAVESFHLLTLGKLCIVAALARKESRGVHKRSDYTFTNPLMNDKLITVKKVGDKPETGMRKMF